MQRGLSAVRRAQSATCWRRALARWMQQQLNVGAALAHNVAQSSAATAMSGFDVERATTICDVLKVRYKLRQQDLGRLVTHHPALLGYSLKQQIVPALSVLDRKLRLGETLRNRVGLRVPRLLSNDFSDLRPELRLALQRVCHLDRAELDLMMELLPRDHGEVLARPPRPYGGPVRG